MPIEETPLFQPFMNIENEPDFSSIQTFTQSPYAMLHNLVSIGSITKERDEVILYKETLADALTNTGKELMLHGLSQEEVDNLNNINETMREGKSKLIAYLQEYEASVDEINKIGAETRKVKLAVEQTTLQLASLGRLDDDVRILSEPFIVALLEKEQVILAEMETKQSLLYIQKDKLETIIKALSQTYGILKNSSFTHTCPICITHEVDMYLEPCGHTLCSFCNKNTYLHCHMCRTKIKVAKNIYYS